MQASYSMSKMERTRPLKSQWASSQVDSKRNGKVNHRIHTKDKRTHPEEL